MSMSEEQLKILSDLADKLENEPNTKENARDMLVRAGILTEKGNVRKPYKEVFTRTDNH